MCYILKIDINQSSSSEPQWQLSSWHPTSSLATRGCITSLTDPLIQLAGLHSCWAKKGKNHWYKTLSNRRRQGSYFVMPKCTKSLVKSLSSSGKVLGTSRHQHNMGSEAKDCFPLFSSPALDCTRSWKHWSHFLWSQEQTSHCVLQCSGNVQCVTMGDLGLKKWR